MSAVVESATSEKRHTLVEILLGISSNNEARFPVKGKTLKKAQELVKKNKVVGLS
jgi:hypothetical protein